MDVESISDVVSNCFPDVFPGPDIASSELNSFYCCLYVGKYDFVLLHGEYLEVNEVLQLFHFIFECGTVDVPVVCDEE